MITHLLIHSHLILPLILLLQTLTVQIIQMFTLMMYISRINHLVRRDLTLESQVNREPITIIIMSLHHHHQGIISNQINRLLFLHIHMLAHQHLIDFPLSQQLTMNLDQLLIGAIIMITNLANPGHLYQVNLILVIIIIMVSNLEL